MRKLPLLALLGLWALGCHGPAPAAAPEASVKPGINTDFLDPALDVDKYTQRFEGESREIFAQRARIAGLVGLREDLAVADVGAGTGLFTLMFASKVGDGGRVYAVDIAPGFLAHIDERARQRQLGNVTTVLATERDVQLPEHSVDVVFVCDTYHHFEYPRTTLASMHRALRPGGQLLIVDFIREPGISRDWILDHVRAGQAEVTREVEAAGFRLVRQEPTPFLGENYFLRFQKM